MNTNETREYKQLVKLLYAANAQREQLRHTKNLARTALRDDIAVLFLKSRRPSQAFLQILNNRVLDLEKATAAEAEAALTSRALAHLVIAATQALPNETGIARLTPLSRLPLPPPNPTT